MMLEHLDCQHIQSKSQALRICHLTPSSLFSSSQHKLVVQRPSVAGAHSLGFRAKGRCGLWHWSVTSPVSKLCRVQTYCIWPLKLVKHALWFNQVRTRLCVLFPIYDKVKKSSIGLCLAQLLWDPNVLLNLCFLKTILTIILVSMEKLAVHCWSVKLACFKSNCA